ncbi:unnamed protein product [Linum tenue]|uniref:Uncharacterized protein n=1 Tax=Linum tenue TaxID=586396 RepID=A0AAV0JWF3_9ROSI|nr:unnamed protein product [Linum tenue]
MWNAKYFLLVWSVSSTSVFSILGEWDNRNWLRKKMMDHLQDKRQRSVSIGWINRFSTFNQFKKIHRNFSITFYARLDTGIHILFSFCLQPSRYLHAVSKYMTFVMTPFTWSSSISLIAFDIDFTVTIQVLAVAWLVSAYLEHSTMCGIRYYVHIDYSGTYT